MASAFLVVLGACAAPPPPASAHDPFENTNRKVHAFNRGLDSKVLRPASQVYGSGTPDGFRIIVSNFASNLGLPGAIVNNTLQGDLESAFVNTGRFILNTTIGIGGLADPATEFGIRERSSDFGQTLHVWGVGEGAYVELPFLGPSTSRDVVGKVVDFAIDPLNSVIKKPESYYATGSRVVAGVGSRYRFRETVDSILYDSADSYAQARLIYLQNRRFELGQETTASGIDTQGDLYDDLYFE